ncbi:MAG: hypothetical protein ABIE36_01180 [Candidatus Diapherotrites archaeon]
MGKIDFGRLLKDNKPREAIEVEVDGAKIFKRKFNGGLRNIFSNTPAWRSEKDLIDLLLKIDLVQRTESAREAIDTLKKTNVQYRGYSDDDYPVKFFRLEETPTPNGEKGYTLKTYCHLDPANSAM